MNPPEVVPCRMKSRLEIFQNAWVKEFAWPLLNW